MNKRVLMLILVISILGAMVTMACDCYCSPGFWKTHGPESRYGDMYWDGYEEDFTEWPGSDGYGLMEALTMKGGAHAGEPYRYAAAAFLNANANCKCD